MSRRQDLLARAALDVLAHLISLTEKGVQTGDSFVEFLRYLRLQIDARNVALISAGHEAIKLPVIYLGDNHGSRFHETVLKLTDPDDPAFIGIIAASEPLRIPGGVLTTSSMAFMIERVALLGLPTSMRSMKCVRSMSVGSMRPPAKPTLRQAASIIAVLTHWNHTPGSCSLGLPPQISKNSAKPIVVSCWYLWTAAFEHQRNRQNRCRQSLSRERARDAGAGSHAVRRHTAL